MDFEWDSDKADENLQKHKVSFAKQPNPLLIPKILSYRIKSIQEAKNASTGWASLKLEEFLPLDLQNEAIIFG